MIFYDSHLHLTNGMGAYDATSANYNFIFNNVDEYRQLHASLPSGGVASLILDLAEQAYVTEQAATGMLRGFKIHSRLQKLTDADYPILSAWLSRLPILPVIYDAFYFGTEMAHQPNLHALVELAQQHPQRPFIVAHAGGYRLLEYFFHLRPLDNVYYDFSFSLQYLADTYVRSSMIKMLRYTPANRLMWGSDYPFAQPAQQQQTMLDLMAEADLDEEKQQQICCGTAQALFGVPTDTAAR